MKQMNKPNLFSYATNELSQDALICWLLSWAKPEYKSTDQALHDCATELIKKFFSKQRINPPPAIDTVKVETQHKRIDVFCVINETYPIIIEDKTGSSNHSGQLGRYYSIIKDSGKYKEENIIAIYFKTEEQSKNQDKAVKDKGYKLFKRADFLEVLNKYEVANAIFSDYRAYLQSVEDQVNSYKTKDFAKWNGRTWAGFYAELEKEERLGDGGWGYVPNQSGGFWGFWWDGQRGDDCSQHLQLSQDKICVKVTVKDKTKQRSLRNKWHALVMDKAKNSDLELKKPKRLGTGKHMTVGEFAGYRQANDKGGIDMEKTVALLKEYQSFLKSLKD